MGIEQKINHVLNQRAPSIKRVAKRVYQRTMYTLFPKIKSEGDIVRVSPNDSQQEYFFGYYGICPEDASGRYVLCLKADNTWSDVAPASPAEILLIDTEKNETDPGRVKVLGKTHTWNVQQGCMAQWLGPNYDREIIYNDLRNGKYCSVILDVFSGDERVLRAPVYSVSRDGSFALTLDFSRLHRMRPGYGYSNRPDKTAGQKLPDSPCIWKLDIMSNIVTPVLNYADFAHLDPRPEMRGAEHKVNHIMLSPNGKRFMVLHRWFQGERKYTRLVTAHIDGSEIYNLSDDNMVSHCYWKNDEEILAFETKRGQGDGYYLMKDMTQECKRLWPQMTADGHPSYSPDGSTVVTDTYPNRVRIATVKIMKESKTDEVAKVFAPFKYDNETRCDLHPRWSRDGKSIYIDSVFEGHRGLYKVMIEKKKSAEGKNNVVILLTACKKKGPVEQMLNLITYMDRSVFNPVLITIYNEPTDGTSQLQKFLGLNIEHYHIPLSKSDVFLGKTSKLKKKLDEIHPQIVHAVGTIPGYAINAMKYPGYVFTIRNFAYEECVAKYGKIMGTLVAKLDLSILKNAAQVWTCSESLTLKYKNELHMDFPFIRNGVNVSKFTRPTNEGRLEQRKKLNLPKDKRIVVYTGTFNKRKNQKFLLEVFAKNSVLGNTILLLLGGGPELAGLKKKYGELKNVIFTGNVTNVNEYLQASDVYISSSTSEGLPNGVLEAMATGLPVILSDITQHQEIFEADSSIGYLYKRGDDKDCLEKILKMDSVACIKAGNAAYHCAHEKFSAERMSKEYQAEYLRIAGV